MIKMACQQNFNLFFTYRKNCALFQPNFKVDDLYDIFQIEIAN